MSSPYKRPLLNLIGLVRELCALPSETEWLEFKVDGAEAQAIGEYISALAKAAALVERVCAYMVWGVRDKDHAVVGTTFDPSVERIGNEQLESWLLRLLESKVDFRFFSVSIDCRTILSSRAIWNCGTECIDRIATAQRSGRVGTDCLGGS